jgi:hypothetical protein
MRGPLFAILITLMLSAQAHEAPGCASTIRELRNLAGDASFSSRWTEVSMDDGKPLVVSIVERNGTLSIEFMKTGEGLWAEISGSICRTGLDFQARMTKEQIHLGPAATWMLGLALADGGTFTLRRRLPNQLQIETKGWTGRFVPAAMD